MPFLINPNDHPTYDTMTEYTYARGRLKWLLAGGLAILTLLLAGFASFVFSGAWAHDPSRSTLTEYFMMLGFVVVLFGFTLSLFIRIPLAVAAILRTDSLKLRLGARGLEIYSGLLEAPMKVSWSEVLDISPVRKAQPNDGMVITLREPDENAVGTLKSALIRDLTGLISVEPVKIGRDIHFRWNLLKTDGDDPLARAKALWAQSAPI